MRHRICSVAFGAWGLGCGTWGAVLWSVEYGVWAMPEGHGVMLCPGVGVWDIDDGIAEGGGGGSWGMWWGHMVCAVDCGGVECGSMDMGKRTEGQAVRGRAWGTGMGHGS